MLNEGLNHLWPTVVMKDSIKDESLLEKVSNEIFTLYDLENPPNDIREDNIFDSDSEILKTFKSDVVVPAFSRYMKDVFDLNINDYPHHKMRAWIAGYSQGYYMANHNHSGSHFSAVFYLMAETHDNGGTIVFEDPRVNANRGYPQELQKFFKPKEFQPKSGDFVVFPCYLYHWVTPYRNRFRLAIPIDLTLYTND